ncbi:GNAT family N-acetyltransferase [Aspergillus undulatus]|uniref:GNAT family N-acetyltransferase n=1 Tax=Aspergillus undulatus TaxID=1810928 RepID=UPI003CCCB0C0
MTTPSLPENYALQPGSPPLESYLALRRNSGLTPVSPAQGAAAVQGTWYACYITYTNPDPSSTTQSPTTTPVAMGNIISNGGWYFHIADMAVLPDHQRKGLGEAVLRHLLAYIQENAPEGEPYVNLLADAPGRKLYSRLGFVDAMPGSLGMVYRGGF